MLCECGCGEDAGVYSANSNGKRKGEPKSFINGHFPRKHITHCKRGHKRTSCNITEDGSCKPCQRIRASERRTAGVCTQCGRKPRKNKATCKKCWGYQLAYKRRHHARILKTQSIKRKKNRKFIRAQHATWRRALKLEMIKAYGGKCACRGCNVSHPDFLTLDHKDGYGARHRKQTGLNGGYRFFAWLKRRGFPKDRFQLLCWNCNCAKQHAGGCPHTKGEA